MHCVRSFCNVLRQSRDKIVPCQRKVNISQHWFQQLRCYVSQIEDTGSPVYKLTISYCLHKIIAEMYLLQIK